MYLIYLLKLATRCPIVRGSQRQFKPKRTSTAYDFRMRCGLQAWPCMSIVPAARVMTCSYITVGSATSAILIP